MGEFESGKDACITSSVMLAVLAVPTHFFIRPPSPCFTQSPIAAISLESFERIMLPLWLASITAAVFS